MGFSSKRGRPKSANTAKDAGTKELQIKRQQGITLEPVDWCWQRGLIDEEQHQCARKFAWLYRLRHGKPWVTAIDMSGLAGRGLNDDEMLWDAKKEQIYLRAVAALQREHKLTLLLNICVFALPPRYVHGERSVTALQEIESFCDGLDVLQKLWVKRP
jgi:hypothetical protein